MSAAPAPVPVRASLANELHLAPCDEREAICCFAGLGAQVAILRLGFDVDGTDGLSVRTLARIDAGALPDVATSICVFGSGEDSGSAGALRRTAVVCVASGGSTRAFACPLRSGTPWLAYAHEDTIDAFSVRISPCVSADHGRKRLAIAKMCANGVQLHVLRVPAGVSDDGEVGAEYALDIDAVCDATAGWCRSAVVACEFAAGCRSLCVACLDGTVGVLQLEELLRSIPSADEDAVLAMLRRARVFQVQLPHLGRPCAVAVDDSGAAGPQYCVSFWTGHGVLLSRRESGAHGAHSPDPWAVTQVRLRRHAPPASAPKVEVSVQEALEQEVRKLEAQLAHGRSASDAQRGAPEAVWCVRAGPGLVVTAGARSAAIEFARLVGCAGAAEGVRARGERGAGPETSSTEEPAELCRLVAGSGPGPGPDAGPDLAGVGMMRIGDGAHAVIVLTGEGTLLSRRVELAID